MSSIARSPAGSRAVVVLAVACALVALAATWWRAGAERENRGSTLLPLRLSLALPADLRIGAPEDAFGLALSPDATHLAIVGTRNGRRQLWLRRLDVEDLVALEGTDGAVLPFWAPDGSAIGFFAGGKLRAFSFASQPVATLGDAAGPRGAVWLADGGIVFAPEAVGPLMRRTAEGGLEAFTTLREGDSGHSHPSLTADGRHIAYFVSSSDGSREGIWIAASTPLAPADRLVRSHAHGVFAGDVLVHASGDALLARRLDQDTLRLSAEQVLLTTAVGHSTEHQLSATFGGNLLVFSAPASAQRELRWFDREGRSGNVLGEPMQAGDVRIAPLGERVAIAREDPQLGTLDIWVYEGDAPLPRRISRGIDADDGPVWSRDGRHLAWVGARAHVLTRDALARAPEVIWRTSSGTRVTDWWPDGRGLVIAETRPQAGSDLLLLPLRKEVKDAEVRAYAASPFNEVQGTVSPDGRALAYASDESGRFEIYVDRFPLPGQRARVTVGGGVEPRWGSSDELFYRRGREIRRVRVKASGFDALSDERVFEAPADLRSFDVARNGGRFLLNLGLASSEVPPSTAVVNVTALFDSLTPRR